MNTSRQILKEQYPDLYDEVERILFEHDLVGVNFGDNTDEYAPEVDTILPRLKSASNNLDVTNIVVEEFNTWFGEDMFENTPHEKFQNMANEVWLAWQKQNNQ